MTEPTSPTHGFFRVQVAWVGWLVVSVTTVVGLHALGLPSGAVGAAFLLVAAGLLVPFWALFRRLQPEGSDAKKAG